MQELQVLYRNLAENLALLLYHPDTNEGLRAECAHLVRPLAYHTELSAAEIGRKPRDVKSRSFRDVVIAFGMAAADVLDAPDADEYLCNELGDCTLGLEEYLKPDACGETLGARLRGLLTAYAGLPETYAERAA